MLLQDHEKYHTMGPGDVGLKEPMHVGIIRTTAQTGEQFQFDVPIYPDDSREMVRNRINFVLSIMQDRMEDENKAVEELNKKQQRLRHLKILIEKNNKTFVNKAKALEKRLKRKAISKADYEAELEQLKAELKAANDPLQAELGSEGEIFGSPVSQVPQIEESVAKEE